MSDLSDVEPAEQHPATTGAPRWVKVLGIITVAVLAIFVVLQVTGVAGDHGPSRHGPGRHTPSWVGTGGSVNLR